MSADELYLENLDEFVNDENRIVTYKWLSTTLKVHVNLAKQMLYAFCEQQRNKKDNEISVTYFVAGSTAGGKGGERVYKCAVVSEETLESYKTSLADVNTVHVYSVQKSKLKDSNALYITNLEGIKEDIFHSTKHSAVQCPWAKVRSREEMERLGVKKTDPEVVKPKVQNGSSSVTSSNGRPSVKKVSVEKKGSIASMFADSRKENGDSKTKPTEPQSEKQNTAVKKKKEPKGSIASMFSNAPKITIITDSPVIPHIKVEEDTKKIQKSEKQKVETGKTKADKTGKVKKKADPFSDDEFKPDKKRRRRIKDDLFDSSSEEEMECLEESPVPSPVPESTPEPEIIEPESPIPEPVHDRLKDKENEEKEVTGERKRRRVRRLVPKTYQDEAGFMVTEKVWESDSTDVSEVEELPAKETQKKEIARTETEQPKKKGKGKTSPQKKSPSPGKTQASLTSFFRKK